MAVSRKRKNIWKKLKPIFDGLWRNKKAKNRTLTGIAIACIVLACIVMVVIIAVAANRPGRSGQSTVSSGMVQLLCKNPQCGQKFEISQKEFLAKGPVGAGLATPVFKCSKCGQESAYAATTCEKCGNCFSLDYQSADGCIDRCPKCGFSKSEEATKKTGR